MKIISPQTSAEFQIYYNLRWEVLRAPWGQPVGSERANDDAAATHALLVNEKGEGIGVGRLHLQTPTEAQIRFMGISPAYQGKGLGRQLLAYLEEKARQAGATLVTLQARENALAFYQSCDYQVIEKTHLLFGTIQHYKMSKELR
jgi:N-acetylglutamate synthase-like GNAT family acetyltransferase